MKKIITVLIAFFTVGGLLAQDGQLQKATAYKKDGTMFYQITGCQPLTQVEFYSKPSGGNLLATVNTDAAGNALVEVPKQSHYAFALNRIRPTKGGDGGAAYYIALGAPVLQLQSVTESNGELRWQVSTQSEGVSCDVFSSQDGAPFVKLASLPQKQGLTIGQYNVENGAATNQTVYSVQVRDAANGLTINLGKKAMVKPDVQAVKVSPTVFTDVLNVQLLKTQTGTLQVFNGSGALVYSGVVKQGHNAIDLAKMAPANYIVKVNDRNNTVVYAGRVVKSQ
jgi:hypothetical protein